MNCVCIKNHEQNSTSFVLVLHWIHRDHSRAATQPVTSMKLPRISCANTLPLDCLLMEAALATEPLVLKVLQAALQLWIPAHSAKTHSHQAVALLAGQTLLPRGTLPRAGAGSHCPATRQVTMASSWWKPSLCSSLCFIKKSCKKCECISTSPLVSS